jgi:sugar/nucleoside kinase (ribokinase family)
VTGLLRGRPLRDVAEHATAVAAYVCTRHGATPTLPTSLTSGVVTPLG